MAASRAAKRIEAGTVGDIGLADDDGVGDRRLLHQFLVARQMVGAVHAVGKRDHRLQLVERGDVAVGEQDLDHRHRVGEAGHLDQHKIEIEVGSRVALDVKVEQAGGDFLVHMAAQAAAVDHAHAVARRLDQHVVDADFAEFVDDHRGAREGVRLEQAIDQRGLAAAEKAGDQEDRNAWRSGSDADKSVSRMPACYSSARERRRQTRTPSR